jgi:hypothetical protein
MATGQCRTRFWELHVETAGLQGKPLSVQVPGQAETCKSQSTGKAWAWVHEFERKMSSLVGQAGPDLLSCITLLPEGCKQGEKAKWKF